MDVFSITCNEVYFSDLEAQYIRSIGSQILTLPRIEAYKSILQQLRGATEAYQGNDDMHMF